jgi:PPK2 family polyphosphate:nucleotide phosphotransferase
LPAASAKASSAAALPAVSGARGTVAAAAAKPVAPGAAAVETVNAVFAELGRPAAAPDKTLRGAFDGGIKKRSFESEFVAPPAVVHIDLDELDPADTRGYSRKEIRRKHAKDLKKLKRQQKKLYGGKQRGAVGLMNGIDTAGKDGRIKGLFQALDPHSASVTSFKQPTDEEVRHHYLWRHVKALPGPGKLVLFNRSYYEDYVVPYVFPQLYKKIWGKGLTKQQLRERLDEMNAFEKRLTDEGYILVKYFLHLSKDEQKRRLEARRDDRRKNYKFSEDDLATRNRWDRYHRAWEMILAKTNTPWAPFFIVPADDKEFADFVVTRLMLRAARRAHLKYPKADPKVGDIVVPD